MESKSLVLMRKWMGAVVRMGGEIFGCYCDEAFSVTVRKVDVPSDQCERSVGLIDEQNVATLMVNSKKNSSSDNNEEEPSIKDKRGRG
jgi:hypothetical protein